MHSNKLDAGQPVKLGAPVLPLVLLKLSEESELGIDAATMLFHDDVVAHRQPKLGAFALGLGCKEWVEYLRFDLFRDTGSIIANTDFTLFSKVLCRSGQHWLETVTGFRFSFRRGVCDILSGSRRGRHAPNVRSTAHGGK